MSWYKEMVMMHKQNEIIRKMYKYYWDKYGGDNKDSYDKIKIHRMCKKDVEFDLDKMSFLKENSISYKKFEDIMIIYERKLFDELINKEEMKGDEEEDV